jgi:magnesium-transporting ATPase (P-type)
MINSEAPYKQSSSLDCPVDFVKVDENRVRVVAFFVVLLVLIYLINGNPVGISLLLGDFLLRAFNFNAYSPLAIIAGAVVKQLGLKNKPVDRAPKRFASFMGVAFLVFALISFFTQYILLSKVIAGTMIIFASLESFAGFCAGCHVYTLINRAKFAYARPK